MAEQAQLLSPSDEFHRHFRQKLTDLQERIDRLKHIAPTGGEQTDAVSHCRSGIARLSGEVNNASSYLPARNREEYGKAIASLTEKLDTTCAALAPRQKFSFRSGNLFSVKKNESAISLNDAAELANQRRQQGIGYVGDETNDSSFAGTPIDSLSPPNEPVKDAETSASLQTSRPENDVQRADPPRNNHSTPITIINLQDSYIVPASPPSSTSSTATLLNLSHSVIDLSARFTTLPPLAGLTLKNITSSLIVCGRIDGAVHLTNIQNSTLLLTSRQFRMHDSSNCAVYLAVPSRPIIEDCSSIRFAPLPQLYASERDEGVENQWSSVDDFKWLKSEPSPNWCTLPPEKRIVEEVWREAVSGTGRKVADALNAVGVAK